MSTAAGLALLWEDNVLLLKRSLECDHPGTWGIPGGWVLPGENALNGALREGCEELGPLPDLVVTGEFWLVLKDSKYLTVVARRLPGPWVPRLNWEHVAHRWVPVQELANTPGLHPGLVAVVPALVRKATQ